MSAEINLSHDNNEHFSTNPVGYHKQTTKSENEQITLTWENVNISLPEKKSFKIFGCKRVITQNLRAIIKNVSGIAKPGGLLAIMGSSGSGKTTLLNSLTFQIHGELKVSGNITVNGYSIKSAMQLSNISGYVHQNDLFIGTLTVREHLLFQLNLKKCENSIIGENQNGISGGERRRLSFATEIITNPGILFCDEPTSGLDSYMAFSVVERMKYLAQQGRTIICTIHQPSSEIFDMFDDLCVLAEGRLVYLGERAKAGEFFQSQGYNCPTHHNLADFFIHKLAVIPTKREECLEKLTMICDNYDKSDFNKSIKNDIENSKTIGISSDTKKKFETRTLRKAKIPTQLGWLIWRNFLSTRRDFIAMQIIQGIVLSTVLGLIYLQQSKDAIQNINGVIYLCILISSYGNILNIINTFPIEIPIFINEYKKKMYGVFWYYLSKIINEVPRFIVIPLITTTIVYWMANLNTSPERFFVFCGTIFLVANNAASFGSLISTASPTTNVALSLCAPLLVPILIFGGYFLSNNLIPKYFIWIKYLSWIGYAYEILIINQWKGQTKIKCPSLKFSDLPYSNSTECFLTGKDVIHLYNMNEENYYMNFGLLIVLLFVWRLVAFLFLLRRSRN